MNPIVLFGGALLAFFLLRRRQAEPDYFIAETVIAKSGDYEFGKIVALAGLNGFFGLSFVQQEAFFLAHPQSARIIQVLSPLKQFKVLPESGWQLLPGRQPLVPGSPRAQAVRVAKGLIEIKDGREVPLVQPGTTVPAHPWR